MTKFEVEITVTEEIAVLNVGDTFKVEVEMPAVEKKPRGQLAGIALADMSDEQLKRELINANSVLYKATQRGAVAETIAANQARVDAAKAEKEKREGAKVKATATPKADAAFEGGENPPTDNGENPPADTGEQGENPPADNGEPGEKADPNEM